MKYIIGSLFFLSALAELGCTNAVSFAPVGNPLTTGLSGQQKSEQFTQGYVSKKIDILIVVDNSTSMFEEQQKMSTRIASFLAQLYDVDWRIGITTTDVSNGTYGLKGELLVFAGTNSYVLTPATPNYEQIFKNTIVRAETYQCTSNCPSGDERAMEAIKMAIDKRDTFNKNFFRNDADLGVMVLSDEDEQSTGPSNALQPDAVIEQIESVWKDSKQFIAYGVIIQPGDLDCYNSQNQNGHYGTFVDRLTSLTHGLTGSICDSDYGSTLGLIGDHVRRLLDSFVLKSIPSAEGVAVKFTPDFTTSTRVAGRRVYFSPPPPKGTEIEIDYIVK
jgi:hypothetical protein